MPAGKTQRSRPSFPVFMRAEIGVVEMGPGAGKDPPAVAAFRIIAESSLSVETGVFEFTPPGGPTYKVEVDYGD